ncbi:CDP-glycerol glycerophosphotransferase family protein [Erysipelatoclostridium sp. AM42-17]|uniref:CDP-glycerol glycerophosphotransferase family protein n=1 Tax=Erysipelatoclostridium sp. AM42-17 TaxID=2293102 RepID=UPI000E4FE469|nr:CDP-glycerol glycerophosphotransferase family protein [Erysipelatoclostridium sp. AM42-17]RHS91996.1 hypothetical protein DW911_09335 [Erysipelatoclostridium sp. AM42-17]
MKIKKIVLNIILGFINIFVKFKKINPRQVAFVSLEAHYLDSDLKLIYDELKKDPTIQIKKVLINYDKKTLINNFLYMLNCIKQIYIINTSQVVLIRDNNYVISKFKRPGVIVIQVWHACGAIKKFGNVIKREYLINNYDYVIANSDYWKEPYSQAFHVNKSHVLTTGIPRVDHLFDQHYLEKTRKKLFEQYPQLINKKIVLYAPTFRGNIYQGFRSIDFDGKKLLEQLPDDYILLYKFHPLLKINHIYYDDKRIFNMNEEDTHDLFTIADFLVSDFSSIIFDFSILEKPMYFYVPDLNEYLDSLGCFVDYQTMPGPICFELEELARAILNHESGNIVEFKNKFFKYQDGQNTKRVVQLIKEYVKDV